MHKRTYNLCNLNTIINFKNSRDMPNHQKQEIARGVSDVLAESGVWGRDYNQFGLREFKTAESAHTRNRAVVTRPFSLTEGWGLETRLRVRVYTCTSQVMKSTV